MELVQLYSDGSCWQGIGGWGTILRQPSLDYEKELSGYAQETTNNRMELTAVIKGLQELHEPCHVHITSDSQYVVGAFVQKWILRWKANNWHNNGEPLKNEDLWRQLWDLSYQHQLAFTWVHGHTGHPENERCDKLALHARKTLERMVKEMTP